MDSFSTCVPYPQSEVSDCDACPLSFFIWSVTPGNFAAELGGLKGEGGSEGLISIGSADGFVASAGDASVSLFGLGLAGAEELCFGCICKDDGTAYILSDNLELTGSFWASLVSACGSTGLGPGECFMKQPPLSMALMGW